MGKTRKTMQKIKRATTEFFTSPQVSELDGKAPNIENQATKTSDVGKQTPEVVEDNSTLYNVAVKTVQEGPTLPSGVQ